MSPGISVIISLHGVQAVMHAGRGPACGGAGRSILPATRLASRWCVPQRPARGVC